MELFQKLGETVEEIWRGKNYDEAIFPKIAADALREANLPEKVSAWEVIEWTMKQTHLPEQHDVAGKFGDPPITLYNSPRFHVDVYFWLEGTTAIHQHAFCGAFQVLMGSSLHSWFEFETSEKINTFTEIGILNLKTTDLLSVGDVQAIEAGKPYIHGLFHLDQPSATIVIRTYRSPLHLPQFNYYKPYLAVDPFFEEPATLKKLQSISSLIRAKHPETDRLISEWLATADFQTTFSILSNLRNMLQSNKLDEVFNPNAPQERFGKFMEIVRDRHGEKANVFTKVFEHRENIEQIIKRRTYITDNEQRFFLALLMNVEGKKRILSLIKEKFQSDDPVGKILDWTFDMANTRVLGEDVPNALGIADFADLDLIVLENLLRDKTAAETVASIREEYGAENTDELSEKINSKIERLQQAVIFRPLFSS